MKALIAVFAPFLFIYLCLCALLYFSQEKFIFFPPKADNQWYSKFKSFEYFIDTGSAKLHGWQVTNPIVNNNASIIYFGGNAEEVAYNLQDANRYTVKNLFFTNMPGYGSSTGKPTEKSFLDSSLKIYDHIIEKHQLDPEDVFIMGRSIGSSVASYLASQRKLKGLILITPFDSIEQVARNMYKIFPVTLFLKHKFNTDKYIDKTNAPILIIAAEKDGVIPEINLTNLYTPRKDKINMITIPGATHNDISQGNDYFSYINGFILSNSLISH